MFKFARASILALLLSPGAHAASLDEHCYQVASLYQLMYSMRDLGLPDAKLMIYANNFPATSANERQQAIERTKSSGDLGWMSTKTLYRHVYLECRGQ